MIKKILRALTAAVSQSGPVTRGSHSRTVYHWRCSCGARSRGGWLIAHGANYAAQRHMWREGVGHPMPDVFSTQERVE